MSQNSINNRATAWTLKSKDGRLSVAHIAYSRHEVEQKVVGAYYDPTALRNDRSFRRLFDEELNERLENEGEQIVEVVILEKGNG